MPVFTRRVRVAVLIFSLVGLVYLSPQGHTQDTAPTQNEEETETLLTQLRLNPEELIDFEKLSTKELEAELALRQRARRAALRRRIEATQAEYNVGFRETSLATVMDAHADLALFELESAQTPAERVRAVQTVVKASRHMELEARSRSEMGALGGSRSTLMLAMSNRLKWEQQLAKELLAMKQVPVGAVSRPPAAPAAAPLTPCPPVFLKR